MTSTQRIVHSVRSKTAVIAVWDECSASRQNVRKGTAANADLQQASVPTKFSVIAIAERDRRTLSIYIEDGRCQVRSSASGAGVFSICSKRRAVRSVGSGNEDYSTVYRHSRPPSREPR